MKVLLITLRADYGGGPEHIYQLCKNTSVEINYFIASPDDKPYTDMYKCALGERNYFYVPHRKFSLKRLWGLYFFIRNHDIKIIHSHGKGAGLYSRLIKLLIPSMKCVHTFHGLHIGQYGFFIKFIYKIYERIMLFLTDKFIAVSNSEGFLIASFLKMNPPFKLDVIENGVYIPPFFRTNKLFVPRSIIVVTRFDFQKNTELVLDIAVELKSILKQDFKFIILGDGEGKVKFLKNIQEKCLDNNFEVLGNVKNPRAFFKSGCCFLSTSRWEGLPLAPIEAMSEGLPVVLSNVVGNVDIITHGQNGYLYDISKPKDAANFLKEIIANTTSTNNLLGLNAWNYVHERFNAMVMCAKTYKIYHNL